MRKIKLSDLTIKKIKKKEFKNLIPELYQLEGVVENSPWHNKESVFDHTLSVLDNLEKIIRNSKKKIKQALNKIIDKNSRKSLLCIAALLHDIGKKETIADLGGGARGCPGHEKKGAQKTKKILNRFNLSPKELKIITDIAKNHGVTHDIVGLGCKDFQKGAEKEHSLTHAIAGLENKDFQKEYKNFKKKFSNIYLELILLAFADTIGSYLKKTKPAEFRCRTDFYKKELKNYRILD
ncbi:MAG: HD domain-containing protein [Candidatus Nealsonbacteria bacterium]|nr:HD domain-containing protein [Candidatus Nealsonbacteria bacterium]